MLCTYRRAGGLRIEFFKDLPGGCVIAKQAMGGTCPKSDMQLGLEAIERQLQADPRLRVAVVDMRYGPGRRLIARPVQECWSSGGFRRRSGWDSLTGPGTCSKQTVMLGTYPMRAGMLSPWRLRGCRC